MSLHGTKRTCACCLAMSANGGTADLVAQGQKLKLLTRNGPRERFKEIDL
jgi:hypothetical protein